MVKNRSSYKSMSRASGELRAGPVKVIQSDGSHHSETAYNPREMARVVAGGAKPSQPSRKSQKHRRARRGSR